jgi:hypothetical protein
MQLKRRAKIENSWANLTTTKRNKNLNLEPFKIRFFFDWMYDTYLLKIKSNGLLNFKKNKFLI